jgi:hypothetical protein
MSGAQASCAGRSASLRAFTPVFRRAMDARERAYHGIDIGKNSFHGHDKRVAIMLRQNWSRGQARLANLPPCLIS